MRTLNQICREALIEEGRMTIHKLQQYMQVASRAVALLNVHVVGVPKRVILSPNSYRAIDCPADYFDWTLVAVCNGGILYPLTHDPGMCIPSDVNDCGQLQPEPFGPDASNSRSLSDYASLSGFGIWLYNWTAVNEYGELNASIYGAPNGQNSVGAFKYDAVRNQLILTPGVQNMKIALEYISTGVNNTNILIPDEPLIAETIISFIRAKLAKGGERAQLEREYEKNYINLQTATFGNFTLHDFIAACRQGYTQGLKA